MSQQSLLIAIATYNESGSLPILTKELRRQLPDAQILIIDDNSPDGTGKWASEFAVENKRVDAIVRSGKLGLGSAAIVGFNAAIDGNFDWVATLDADLSHDPVSLKEMYKLAIDSDAELDLVIGSRYVSGGKILGWPVHRKISSYLTNLFARTILRLKNGDNTSAMRIYRVDCLRQIDLNSIQSQGYSYLQEILLCLKKVSARTKEFPITFQNRETGRSKADLFEVSRSLYQILRLSFRH